MNNYRYNNGRMMQNQNRNYGKPSDCGCMKPEQKPFNDCGCVKPEVKGDMDCGCEKKKDTDCGCVIEHMYHEMKKGGSSCGCDKDMDGMALAMAYVPWQSWGNLYEICEGFKTGTIFKDLDLEFLGRRCN